MTIYRHYTALEQKMEPLTEKQRKVLEFLEGRLAEGRPPSQRHIAAHFHLAQNAVFQLIRYLKQKGYLRDIGGHRGLRLSEQYLRQKACGQGLPIIGSVAAGRPILAEENIEDYLDPGNLVKTAKGDFLLKVVGDSMVDEGILDGDLVVVTATRQVRTGRIAVVLIDDDATVKRVCFEPGKITLRPANRLAGYKPQSYKLPADNVRIIGEVVACLRTNIDGGRS
jgi:repressor LexA